jgi:hypothetical protein
VVKVEFLLQPPMRLLANPARLDRAGQTRERGVGGQVRELVLALSGRPTLADQPYLLARQVRRAHCADPPRRAVGDTHAPGGEAGQLSLRQGASASIAPALHRHRPAHRVAKSACKGRTVPMEKLDHLVTRHVAERVLMPERLEALLQSVVDRRVKADAEVRGRIDELSRERTTAEDKLRRLYRLVADGVAEPDDMLKERIARLKADLDRAPCWSGSRIRGQPQVASIQTSLPARAGHAHQHH